MNSQSSINWVQLRNSNLNVDWDHVYTLVDREASTFWWEASVDRLGPFTVNDLNLTKLAQICIEKNVSIENFHASEQNKRFFTQASEQNEWFFTRANERSGTLIEILLSKHERAVSMTKRTRGWFENGLELNKMEYQTRAPEYEILTKLNKKEFAAISAI